MFKVILLVAVLDFALISYRSFVRLFFTLILKVFLTDLVNTRNI
jgi:hypothetical protein